MNHLHKLRDAIGAATRGVALEDLIRHREGKWSIAEILEHLSLTYSGTSKGFQRCLAVGKPLATNPNLKHRFITSVVVGMGHMPNGRQTPEPARPKGARAEQVLAGIGPLLESMDKLIEECEERYGSNVRLLDHPILGPLTGPQWRKFHWVHGRHHIRQILQLRGHPPV